MLLHLRSSEIESLRIGLRGTIVAQHTHAGFGKGIHAHMLSAMGALGKEHHRPCFFRRSLLLRQDGFAKTADRVAERDLSIGILDDFAREAALEATSLAVSHAEDKLRLGKVFAAAEHFPVTMIAVTIGDVVPHNFGFGEPKHTAEPFVAREDSPALVDLEARDIEIVFVFGHHIAPPLR